MEKKFFIDWNNEIPQEEFINNILADEDLVKIRSLVISRWGECYEESCQPIIDMFAEHAERFAHLESLFIGDMESEECEISWIKQGDYSRLYAALPNLKKLTIKGTQDWNWEKSPTTNWSTWKSSLAVHRVMCLRHCKTLNCLR